MPRRGDGSGNQAGDAHPKDTGLEHILRRLPDMIARANEDGHPVIVPHKPGELDEAHQRLYATLGVLVRFTKADGQAPA